MSTSNRTLLHKADLALSDLAANGGLLEPEQARRFIRKLIKSPTILRLARVVEMTAPQRNINKIQFNKRILRAATSATELDTAAVDGVFNPVTEATARAKPITEQVVLQTKEVIAEVRIPYDVMEDAVERANIGTMTDVGGTASSGGIRDTIVELMAERAALDLEELALLGDTSLDAADPYLDLTDGWLLETQNNGNTADQAQARLTKKTWKSGLQAMPVQYMRNRASMRHMISKNNEVEYRDFLADRSTGGGDAVISGNNPVFGFGVPIEMVMQMPEDKGLLTNPLNLIFGIQRQIHVEFDKIIGARVYQIVLTARIDFQVEEAEAAVLYTNIGQPA